MRRTVVLSALLVVGALSITRAAVQQPAGQPAPRVVEIEKLKDNLYVGKALVGGGGNTMIFVRTDGVVVVDTKNPGWGQPLLTAIRTVTDKPVRLIINTHTHGDHVSGNVEFPAEVDVVTHVNTAENMKRMQPNSSNTAPPPPNIFTQNNGRGMPKRTFTDRMTIGEGNERIDLRYFGRAHTNGDAIVLFPAQRVLHIADVFPGTELPIMDANNGGTGVGYAETLGKILAFSEQSADVIVNGHRATTSTNAELKSFIGFVQGYVKGAQDAKRAGQTFEAFAAAWKPPAGYTAQQPRVLSNARLIFDETR
jgi:glyoxylase-like metal-dependent hydrolase (beta-lactamase superfamily II)